MQRRSLPEFWRDRPFVSMNVSYCDIFSILFQVQFAESFLVLLRVVIDVIILHFYNVQPVDPAKEHNCIPDEHYVQTLLAVRTSVNYFVVLIYYKNPLKEC